MKKQRAIKTKGQFRTTTMMCILLCSARLCNEYDHVRKIESVRIEAAYYCKLQMRR